jgi:hypothetical protein
METQFNVEDAYGAIKLDGFDNCIIGIVEEFGNGLRILYSKEKIINELCEEMTIDEALEFYDFNILGGYFGEQNPIFYLK